eukprot:Selendium_serpulae@DN4103_c0_g1_i4.p1
MSSHFALGTHAGPQPGTDLEAAASQCSSALPASSPVKGSATEAGSPVKSPVAAQGVGWAPTASPSDDAPVNDDDKGEEFYTPTAAEPDEPNDDQQATGRPMDSDCQPSIECAVFDDFSAMIVN